jgi:L-threonylcarbamoyladenylate synthase
MILTIKDAARILRKGGVVAFPTETVYGLGANALDAGAVQKVYELKGRPATSPLIVHVDSIEMARTLVTEWPPLAEELARKYWPGPLTMVLPKQAIVPDIVTAGLGTVGIRLPAHPIARALITEAGVPLAAPSANKFTGVSPTTAEHVRAAFGDAVPVIDGGPCEVGIESTVVAIEGSKVVLLRPGMMDVSPLPDGRGSLLGEGEAHPAPGMHHRHYSPRTPVLLIGDPSQLPGSDGAYLWRTQSANVVRAVQMPGDPQGYAARLYATLHQLDHEALPWIAIEAPPDTPEWSAIRDRLSRAASK